MRFYLIFVFSLTLLWLGAQSMNADKNKAELNYNDLNSKYSITGPLGIILGKAMELEAQKINLNTKQNPDKLQILSINGKKLQKPVLMNYKMFIISDEFEAGKIYKIKAYQDGGFTGIPIDALKENMVQTTDYAFEVWLVVIKHIK